MSETPKIVDSGEVVALLRRPSAGGPVEPMTELALEANKGIVGDHGFSGKRHVTILTEEAWQTASEEIGQPVSWEARRANVLVRGVDLEATRGQTLVLGDCKITIRGETRPCDIMDRAAEGLRRALTPEWRAGVYGDVVEGGTLRPGDAAVLYS